MKSQNPSHLKLTTYVNNLQANGRYTFLKEEALRELNITENAFKAALYRLQVKGRILKPRNKFYVIVPLEYLSTNGPPPSWFIDDLMKFQKQPYYVGLLSAAALHGAAHQQPQEFQVITNKPQRPILIANYSIRFFIKHSVENTPVISIKTYTGYMQVSTSEATAFDLLRYIEGVGGLNHAATVLTELLEQINDEALLKTAQAELELATIQRSGFLLDYCGGEEQTKLLANWINQQKPRSVPLDPTKDYSLENKNDKWRVYVNEEIEADL